MVKRSMGVDEVEDLLSRALVGRLGMCMGGKPYIVPVCFIHHDHRIYFHSSPRGRKMSYMRVNPNVCFQVDEYRLVSSEVPCKFTMHYRSVLVFGKVHFIADLGEKLRVLRLMMRKYDPNGVAKPLDESMIGGVEVGEIIIEEITGRKSG
ncbi:MAG: pyridoxamine 5'-phosphate oxidase family protein [archaeon YNP-LCB-024-027]|nr:pyridoxamine 5'-phosphate oxidase family protein [Candidatus Culexarchaeum yellowstonense]